MIYREALQAITWTFAASPMFPAAGIMRGIGNKRSFSDPAALGYPRLQDCSGVSPAG